MDEFLQVAIVQKNSESYKEQFEFFKKFMLFEEYSTRRFTTCKHVDVGQPSQCKAFLPLKRNSFNNPQETFKDLIENHFSSRNGNGTCQRCNMKGNYVEEKTMAATLNQQSKSESEYLSKLSLTRVRSLQLTVLSLLRLW